VAFSPDGEFVLTGSWDGTAKLWSLDGIQLKSFKGHEDYVISVAFSPDGQNVLTVSRDGTALLWPR
jgi:WD40 repeat protein